MFCEPEALVAPTLCVSREVKRIAKRAGRIRARNDGREIEDRERGHDCAWLLVYGSEWVGTSRFQVHPPGLTALMARMRTRESCESSQPGSGSVAYLEAVLKLQYPVIPHTIHTSAEASIKPRSCVVGRQDLPAEQSCFLASAMF